MSSRTPKTIRTKDSFIGGAYTEHVPSNANTISKEHPNKKKIERTMTNKVPERRPGFGHDGGSYHLSNGDVMSVGTKHRPSITQASNNDM